MTVSVSMTKQYTFLLQNKKLLKSVNRAIIVSMVNAEHPEESTLSPAERAGRYFARHADFVAKEVRESSHVLTFVYHPEDKTCDIERVPFEAGPIPNRWVNYPECVFKFMHLSKEDGQRLKDTVRQIDEGAPFAECTLQIVTPNGHEWLRERFFNFYKADGSPDYALAFSYNITQEKNRERGFADQIILRQQMQNVILEASCFNVTRDTVVSHKGLDDSHFIARGDPCSAEMRADILTAEPRAANQGATTLYALLSACAAIPDDEERAKFASMSCHYGLIDAFNEGRLEQEIEYRRMLGENLHWVKTRIVLMINPESQDLYAFFYTTDINAERQDERIRNFIMKQSCDFVAVINLPTQSVTFRYMNARISQLAPNWAGDRVFDYDLQMQRSIYDLIREEERERIRRLTSLRYMRSTLELSDTMVITYELVYKGSSAFKQVKYSWLDEFHNDVIAVQQDMTDAWEQQQHMTAQLRIALDAAEQSNRAKSDFLSRMSHDIRTPMNAIIGFSTLLLRNADNKEKVLDEAKKILNSSEHLLGLINDVLDMSKIESGKVQLNDHEVNLFETVATVESIMRTQFDMKKQKFTVDTSGLEDKIYIVDDNRLQQILINILSNAHKYTQEGGEITFTVKTASLHSSTIMDVVFTVADNGRGMSKEFQKHIFEPFSRENESAKEPYRGTGLGMAITKNMVSLMGGTIRVTSEAGKGSMFLVLLPLSFLERAEHGQKAADEAGAIEADGTRDILNGLNILAAEDNVINAEILIEILKLKGANVTVTENGEEVVKKFVSEPRGSYDVILMDVQMPQLDGYGATRKIRALAEDDTADPALRKEAGKIPIIAMTANAFSEDVQKALLSGMNAHVAKPLNVEVLERTLRSLFSGGGRFSKLVLS